MPNEAKRIMKLPAGEGVLQLGLGWSAAAARTLMPSQKAMSGQEETPEFRERKTGALIGDFVAEHFPFDKRLELVRARETNPFLYVSEAILNQHGAITSLSGTLRIFSGTVKREEAMTIAPQQMVGQGSVRPMLHGELPQPAPK